MDIFSFVTLFGGLAFFLYGMTVLSESLKKTAGGKLEKLLKKATSNPVKGLTIGAIITIAIQSSSAMTVMLCMLVDSMMIGRYLGVDSMTAYGLANPVLLIFAAYGAMLSAGIQVMCGRTMGAGDKAGTDACFSAAALLALSVSLLGTVLILAFVSPLCGLLGAGHPGPGNPVFGLTRDYLRGFILGAPAFIVAQIMVPFLQISGNRIRLALAVVLMTVSDIGFDLLRRGHVELCLADRSVEGDMAARIHLERHDGVYLRRIAYSAVIDIDLSAEVERSFGCAVPDVDGTMGFDLRQVFLIDRIGDVGSRQDGNIHIRDDAVQRSGDPSADICSQFTIDRYRSALGQFDRRKTVRRQRNIHPHSVEVESSGERDERAVRSIDR